MKRTRLQNCYHAMKQRCYNPNNPGYKYYGARGIVICDEWLDYTAFEKWALANGYAENLTIDREKSDQNYCPENCRWITQEENTRRAFLGKKRTVENREKLRIYRTGLERPDMKGKNNTKARAVMCIETGEVFQTITDAASSINLHRTYVSLVVRGKQEAAGGYHWKYAD